MKAIKQEPLLTVIVFPIISKNCEEPTIVTTESLILPDVDIITETVGSGEIIFCSCVMDGRILVIVNIHSGFALYPTGVVPIHTRRESYTEELPFSLDPIDDDIASTFLNRVLLSVRRMEISYILRKLLLAAGDDIVQVFWLAAAILHCNPASCSERHLEETIVTTPRSDQHDGGIQNRISSVPVDKVLIVGAAKESGERRLHGRIDLVVPINPKNKAVPDISGKPHVLDDARALYVDKCDSASGRNRYGRGELCAISTP
jgi:hypothetical protein